MNRNLSIFLALSLGTGIVISSCDSSRNSFYSKSYGRGSRSACPAYGGSGSSGSGYASPNTYYYSNGSQNLQFNSTPQNSTATSGFENNQNYIGTSSAMAGILTGGETNDLGKWDLWNDMVKSSLDAQIKLWKMYPYNRYAVLLQTEDGMPVQGAKVTLLNKKKEPIWKAITDNTGAAQLWQGMFKNDVDTSVLEISIEYKGILEKIEKPVNFFKGINTKKLSTPYVKPNNVDIAFVVDATGSMGDEIEYLQEELNDIINKTTSKYKDIDLKLGSVFYRCQGNSYTTRSITLTKEFSAVTDFIKEQYADEGGTEAVEIAMEDAINKLKWRDDARTRIMFFVLDEPSGYSDKVIEKIQEQIQKAAEKGIKIIPIVASGSGNSSDHDRNLEFLMRTSALATNGNYIFMTDHSGVGGTHTEPIIDNYEVEKLNDIIVRTIDNNIYMPDKVKPESPETPKDTLFVDNTTSVLDEYLEDLGEKSNDSMFIASILPYTEYSTADELNKNRPVEKLDTAQLIADIKAEVHTLTIYPNPSSGMIKAAYNTPIEFLYLADLSGKILNRLSAHETTSMNIDLNEYPSGIYLVQYPDGEKWISAKIVLQK